MNDYCQMAGEYDIFGLELIFKDPYRNDFPNDLAETQLADEIMVTNHYGTETFKQNRTINTASVAV